MTVSKRPMTEIRTEDDRTQETLDFIEAVLGLCRERGFAIGARPGEDSPVFEVYRFERPEKLEPNLGWFGAADEVRWLHDEHVRSEPPREPPDDPFLTDREKS